MASRRDCDIVCDVCSDDTFNEVKVSTLSAEKKLDYVFDGATCYVCTKILCDTCTLICGGDCKDGYKFICKPCYFQRYNKGIKPEGHYVGVIWMCDPCANDPTILPLTVGCDGIDLKLLPAGKTWHPRSGQH